MCCSIMRGRHRCRVACCNVELCVAHGCCTAQGSLFKLQCGRVDVWTCVCVCRCVAHGCCTAQGSLLNQVQVQGRGVLRCAAVCCRAGPAAVRPVWMWPVLQCAAVCCRAGPAAVCPV